MAEDAEDFFKHRKLWTEISLVLALVCFPPAAVAAGSFNGAFSASQCVVKVQFQCSKCFRVQLSSLVTCVRLYDKDDFWNVTVCGIVTTRKEPHVKLSGTAPWTFNKQTS